MANEELKQLRAMVSFLKEQKNKIELQLSQEQMQLSTAHAEIISLRNNNTKLIRQQKKQTLNSFLKAKKGGGDQKAEDDGEEEVVMEVTSPRDDILANSLLSELEQAELESIGKKENEEVTDLKKLISEREARLLALDETLRAKESELEAKEQQWRGEAEGNAAALKALRDEILEREEQIRLLRERLEETNRANTALRNTEAELHEKLAQKDQELRTTLRNALERLSQSQEGEINALKAERDELERLLEKKERECKLLEKEKAKEIKMLRMEYELDRTLEAKKKKGEGGTTTTVSGASARKGEGEGGEEEEGVGGGSWWNTLWCFYPPRDDLELPSDEFELRPPKRNDRYSAMKELK